MIHPMTRKALALSLIAGMAAPSALFAQEATPTPSQDPALAQVPDAATESPNADLTTPSTTAEAVPVDCDAEFKALDTDGNTVLSPTEAPREMARAAIDGIVPGTDGLTQEQFTQLCTSSTWSAAPEEGAPFEGANSFTEEQARERAMAWSVTNVSPLTLDETGIWRGTGTYGGAQVSVAVDYKGNVVTTPPMQP